MKALTLRNIPSDIQRLIEEKAAEQGTSAAKAVIELLKECAGGQKNGDKVFNDLDSLAGVWSKEEASQFEKTLKRQRQIDPELWK